MTTGIYKIFNKNNPDYVYVGQAVNIHNRWLEHIRAAQPDKYSTRGRDNYTDLHKAMRKDGIDNFTIEILEECNKDDLDKKEIEWIERLNSYNNGFNMTKGGQCGSSGKGERHSQAKLAQKDVDKIYSLLENGYTVKQIHDMYNNISKSTISLINTGHIWKKDNYIYPISTLENCVRGSNNGRAQMDEQEVIEIRQYYVNHSFQEVVNKYINKYTYSNIRSVVYGSSWKHLPIYKKRTKEWI